MRYQTLKFLLWKIRNVTHGIGYTRWPVRGE